MTDNSGLRSLALPAKDADTFNAYLTPVTGATAYEEFIAALP